MAKKSGKKEKYMSKQGSVFPYLIFTKSWKYAPLAYFVQFNSVFAGIISKLLFKTSSFKSNENIKRVH